jgi:hypothetical protein
VSSRSLSVQQCAPADLQRQVRSVAQEPGRLKLRASHSSAVLLSCTWCGCSDAWHWVEQQRGRFSCTCRPLEDITLLSTSNLPADAHAAAGASSAPLLVRPPFVADAGQAGSKALINGDEAASGKPVADASYPEKAYAALRTANEVRGGTASTGGTLRFVAWNRCDPLPQ